MRTQRFPALPSIARWAQRLRDPASVRTAFGRSSVAGLALVLLAQLALWPVAAHAQTTYGEEAKTRLQLAERVAPLTEDSAFGEQIGQFSGSLSFRYVDVSLPGNDGLKVEFARVNNNEYSPNFWGWDIDIPKITSVMPQTWAGGWTSVLPEGISNGQVIFDKKDYWNGFRMRFEGQTTPLLYKGNDARIPTGPSTAGGTQFMTKGGWHFEAIPAEGRPGESLVGIAPNGNRYYFDHLVTGFHDTVMHPTKVRLTTNTVGGNTVSSIDPQTLPRDIYVLYVSRVEDRFNNSVDYIWNGSKLERIEASDGRVIQITSDTLPSGWHEVREVRVGSRTWTYNRQPTAGTAEVINPDGSKWQYSGSWFGIKSIQYDREVPIKGGQRSLLEDIATCTKAYPITAGQVRNLSVTAPSGAKAEYVLKPMRHGRSKVPLACTTQPGDDERTWMSPIARYIDSWTLERKTVSGPGIPTRSTDYLYSGMEINFDPADANYVNFGNIWTTGDSIKTVTATRLSDGRVRTYRFGRDFNVDEGLLMSESVSEGSAPAQRTTSYTYPAGSDDATQPFAPRYGTAGIGFGDSFNDRHSPVTSTVISQGGATFTNEVLAFNQFVTPVTVRKSSSLGSSKTETMQPYYNQALWVLGQPGTNTVDGVQTLRVEYNAAALPERFYVFGDPTPQQTVTYVNGLVRTVADARNKITTLNDWHRGVPRAITFADQTSVAATVDANGWVRSVTDQLGNVTCYGYDPMGRTSLVTPPGNVSCAPITTPGEVWTPTSISFAPQTQGAMGLPAGHWLRTEQRGNYRKLTRYDAFWRPVIDHEYDNANVAGTQRFRGWKYDVDGQTTFEGYPRSEAENIADFGTEGVTSSYDALGRPEAVSQHSEDGSLITAYTYQQNFETDVLNPRGKLTRFAYQAFDTPDTSKPVRIVAPEGATTTIARDVFGKPISIKREGLFNSQMLSVTRSYVYDARQRLCKRIEPETGSTLMSYDVAGNLLWSASGLNLPSTTNCDTAPANLRVLRTYDDLNRVKTLRFPDGLGDQDWVYTPDGLPTLVTTTNSDGGVVVNSYEYNTLRLLKSEGLSQDGGLQSTIGYHYSGNAHLSQITYPSSLAITYQPNALGQATGASTFANNVSYWPNGAIKQFTYGNGLVHTLEQNARGLPERSRDALGATVALDDSYDYDDNGNVAAISDALPGNRGDRTMAYDGLDRLTRTDSPMFGIASYGYDPLDNLRTVAVSQGSRARSHVYSYDGNQRLTGIATTGGATVATLGYDVQGNLSMRNGQAYSFDFGNRLREVPGIEQYRYDGNGRRVRAETASEGAIHSFYGQDGVLRSQRDERAGKSTEFVYLGGSMVARVSTPIGGGGPPGAPVLSGPGSSADGNYTLNWTSPTGSNYYRLEELSDKGGFEEIQGGADSSAAFTGKADGSYQYRVRACTNSTPTTCGGYSNVVTVEVGMVLQPPVLSAPETSTSGSYVVSWTSSNGASFYRLEERKDGGPWGELLNSGVTSFGLGPKTNGVYDYRVRACSSNVATTCGAYSTIVTVTVNLDTQLAAPVILANPTNTTGSYVVTWTPITGATLYRLEEQANGGQWQELYAGIETSRGIGPRDDGTYGYRARACASEVASTCGGYSDVVTVTVSTTSLAAPVISANPTNTTGSYVVTWTPITGATLYRLEEQANGGQWQELYAGIETSRGIGPRGDGIYGYRVRACSSNVPTTCSDYSATVTVTVDVIILPPAPVLSAPASSSNGNYTVTWAGSVGATRYRLEEQINGGAWNEIQHSNVLLRTLTGKTNGTYGYRVRACADTNISSCGTYSNVVQVVVGLLPDPPNLSAPLENTTGSYTVSWSMPSGATHYRLEQRNSYTDWTELQNNVVVFRNFSNQPSDVYEYRVRACASATNVSACGAYSFPRTVRVDRAGTPPSPTISGPNSAPAGTVFTLNWTNSSGATSYSLEGNFNGGTWSALQTTGATSHPRQEPTNGFYRYRVRACASNVCSLPGNVHLVQVQPVSQLPSHPIVTAPVNPFNGNFTVSWTQPSGANWYRLEESNNNGASFVLVYSGPNSSIAITGRPQGAYLYRARACISSDLATCGGYSDDATVVVGPMDPMDPPSITLPASSTTGTYGVSWTSMSGAGSYKLEERVNGGAFVQILDDSTTTQWFFNKPVGTYSYRVRACRALIPTDCSNYSQIKTISVASAPALIPPTLTTPNSANAGTNFFLSWTSVTGATSYTVEKSRNFSPYSLVYTGPATSKLQMETQTGSWTYRVKACAGSTCSAWSPTRTVFVN